MTQPRTVSDDLRVIKRLIYISVAIVVIASGLGYKSNNDQIHDIVATRTEGRYTTCASDQAFELNHNKLVKGTQDLIKTVFGDTANARPADEREAIRAYAAARVAEFEKTKVQVRDCTPGGITQFYENAPKPKPCADSGDGKGYCK